MQAVSLTTLYLKQQKFKSSKLYIISEIHAVLHFDLSLASFKTLRAQTLKGKVFPYSLPSVGPGADPGVQAVSPQVT